MAFRGNLKRRLAKANADDAAWAVLLGPDEVARGEATIKSLLSGEQFAMPISVLLNEAEYIGGTGWTVRTDPNDESTWNVLVPEPGFHKS
jgi:hypothetical protein